MNLFTVTLIFCAGLCTGFSGFALYLGYLNREDKER